jgi:hypothetical protein
MQRLAVTGGEDFEQGLAPRGTSQELHVVDAVRRGDGEVDLPGIEGLRGR